MPSSYIPVRGNEVRGACFFGDGLVIMRGRAHSFRVGRKVAKLWTLIDGKRTVAEIHDLVSKEIEFSKVGLILLELKEMKLIR